jgi:hypothetical protein
LVKVGGRTLKDGLIKMVMRVALFIFLIVGLSHVSPAVAARKAKKPSAHLLSYTELLKLKKPQRLRYLRGVARRLANIPERTQRRPAHYGLLRLLWETAHASQFQCIGGGIFVATGVQGCGMSDYAGFRCSGAHEGQDMCNPLIFGVKPNGDPVCHPKATTSWCYRNTAPDSPNASSRLRTTMELVWQRPEARREWTQFQRDVEQVCVNRDYSGISERDSLVRDACHWVNVQTRVNRRRIERGLQQRPQTYFALTEEGEEIVTGEGDLRVGDEDTTLVAADPEDDVVADDDPEADGSLVGDVFGDAFEIAYGAGATLDEADLDEVTGGVAIDELRLMRPSTDTELRFSEDVGPAAAPGYVPAGGLFRLSGDSEIEEEEVTLQMAVNEPRYPHDVSRIGNQGYALYQYATAGSGRCIEPLPKNLTREQYRAILRRNNMDYRGNPSTAELRELATGIRQVERLLGGPVPENWRTNFIYINSPNSTGRYTWNAGLSSAGNVIVRRPGNRTSVVSRYIHELGHFVGNYAKGAWYGRTGDIPGFNSCRMTTYCGHSHNERFAEIFAGFVTYPELLEERCPRVYNYLAENMFPGAEERGALASCNGETRSEVTVRLPSAFANPTRETN